MTSRLQPGSIGTIPWLSSFMAFSFAKSRFRNSQKSVECRETRKYICVIPDNRLNNGADGSPAGRNSSSRSPSRESAKAPPDSYYTSRELVPADMLEDLERAKIVITNYHAFKLRERMELSKGGRSRRCLINWVILNSDREADFAARLEAEFNRIITQGLTGKR